MCDILLGKVLAYGCGNEEDKDEGCGYPKWTVEVRVAI